MKFYISNIREAVASHIENMQVFEKDHLGYDKDSVYVAGLKDFLKALDSGEQIELLDIHGKVKIKSVS